MTKLAVAFCNVGSASKIVQYSKKSKVKQELQTTVVLISP